MDVERIRELNKLMEKNAIAELELKDGDFECKIKKSFISQPLSSIQKEEEKEPAIIVKSSTVGIFYPKVKEDETVSTGSVVGTVMVVGHPHEVVSPVDGKVIQVIVKEGFPVQYGQPLLLIS
ncbi:TPA: hypothetical protein DCX16_05515 [bacterium]|nr:hypothetical protein [bacterium]